jgi:hypothetical protein
VAPTHVASKYQAEMALFVGLVAVGRRSLGEMFGLRRIA